MNTFKLSLENFQSITKGSLEFTTGQNFIIGQSNSGKTATFRAIKACLLNPKGSQRFIKKGYNNSSVCIEYNGNNIVWKRNNKESSYIINGEEYVKTGSSNAFKIIEDTGFTLGLGNSDIMNIEGELDIPFPFSLSGSELFKLFENIFCISDSAVILKVAKENEDKEKKEIEGIELDINKNERKIKALEELKEEVDLKKLADYKSYLTNYSGRLVLLKEDLPFIKKVKELDEQGIDVPLYVLNDDLVRNYQELVECKRIGIRLKGLHQLSKQIPKYSLAVNDKVEEYKTLKLLKSLHGLFINLQSFDNKLDRLNELRSLKDLYNRLKQLHKISKITLIDITESNSKHVRLKELKDLKLALADIKDKINNKQARYEQVNIVIKNTEDKLKEFKVCPLCHQELK